MSPAFPPDLLGDDTVELVVTGSPGASCEPAEVVVSCVDYPAMAGAGTDQAITSAGTVIQQDGTESWDPDGDDLVRSWAMIVLLGEMVP